MKHLKLITAIFFTAMLFFACSGNSQEKVSKNSTPASKNSFANSKGDASFSCKIDGKDFSGKGNDSYSNAVLKTGAGIINFVLVPMNLGIKDVPPQIKFVVADKGVTTVHGDNNPKYNIDYSPGGLDNDFNCKEMTVTITSSDASRVKGTFSGILTNPKNGDKETRFTDGVFDLPYSPYSNK